MTSFFAVIVFVVIVAAMVGSLKEKHMKAKAEGLAPLTRAQEKAARRAASSGKPYKPRRRPYGTLPPFIPGQKRFD